jgi:hypothetical protein
VAGAGWFHDARSACSCVWVAPWNTVAPRPVHRNLLCVHQDAQGGLAAQYVGAGVDCEQVRTALLDVFGQRAQITVEQCTRFGDKVIQYTLALAGALA